MSRPIVPPPDALQAALPDLELSQFLAAVFSTTKAKLLRKSPKHITAHSAKRRFQTTRASS